MSYSITAIITAFESVHVLPACLAALQRAGVTAIVVDNASADDTATQAANMGARVLRNAQNQGFGRAMNRGVAAAETDYVLLLNPDIELEADTVPRLMQAAARYPDAGMYAPQIVEPSGRVFYQNRSLLCESVMLRNAAGDARANGPEGDCCAPFLSGACFLMRRDLFLAMGGFDPDIFMFYEDDDLCRRLLEQKKALVHVHDAIARHARGQSSAPMPGRRYKLRWHLGWSRVYIARKYGLKTGGFKTIFMNAPKVLFSRLAFRRMDVERYGGIVAGTIAALQGKSALEREGLTRQIKGNDG